jgi:hypothetical protein
MRAALVVVALAGCAGEPPSATPEGAVRAWVERLAAFDGREEDARALYESLSERARENLRARAERYGAASGKSIAPWAMLVPGRGAPRFAPHTFRAQVVGKYALVDVAGVTEQARIACLLEEGAWRLDLALPDLPPMRRRPGGDP